jgi:GxxExxY protein
LNAAFEVHSHLGPGLPESACQICLPYKVRQRAIHAEAEIALPVVYKGIATDCGYRIDMLVEKDKLTVENRAVKKIDELHLSRDTGLSGAFRDYPGFFIQFQCKIIEGWCAPHSPER